MQKLLQVVLSAWREAERVATERPEGSREREAALIATERLHSLYSELLDSARADHDAAALRIAGESVDLEPRPGLMVDPDPSPDPA